MLIQSERPFCCLCKRRFGALRHRLFADDAHVEVEITRDICQRIVASYCNPNKQAGRTQLAALIKAIAANVPAVLSEVVSLGRTLNRWATDILAYLIGSKRQTGLPRPSTADWNTYAVQYSGSGAWPTTDPEHSWEQADSGPGYPKPDGLLNLGRFTAVCQFCD